MLNTQYIHSLLSISLGIVVTIVNGQKYEEFNFKPINKLNIFNLFIDCLNKSKFYTNSDSGIGL